MSVAIDKICIKIRKGEKPIELSVDEARELQELLNDTLGKVFLPMTAPVIIERIIERPYRYWEITWGREWNESTSKATSSSAEISFFPTYTLTGSKDTVIT